MKVKVFIKSANAPKFENILLEFAEGIKNYDEVTVSSALEYTDCDCAVFFGSWKPRPTPWHQVKNSIVQHAPNFVVLETPLIGRAQVREIMPDNWYRIGLNGYLRDTGDFNNKNKCASRWEKIQQELDVTCDNWTNNKSGPIVLALQIPGDASLRGCDISKWAYNRIVSIRRFTDREIIVRTPQLERPFDLPSILKAAKNVKLQRGTKENLHPTLKEAYCTITYTSGLAVDSILSGCPTIAYNPGNFAFDISSNFIADINKLKKGYRQQWLNNLSYCQWNEEEIALGLPWKHLRERL